MIESTTMGDNTFIKVEASGMPMQGIFIDDIDADLVLNVLEEFIRGGRLYSVIEFFKDTNRPKLASDALGLRIQLEAYINSENS